MTYIIAGAAGFIGSHVTQLLLDEGHEVVGIDNLNDHYDPRLKTWRLNRLREHDTFTFHRLDIAEEAELETTLEGTFDDTEAIINLAARAGVRQSTEDPHAYVRSNITGTLNLLELCRHHDIETLLIASTSSLYGAHNPTPYSEDANTDLPLSPYAATKKGVEALAASYAHLYDLDLPIPRYFTVYGPAGRPRMAIFRFIRWIAEGEPITLYGDGTQERDFTYVEDIARGTVEALDLDGFEIVNLGNDDPVALKELIHIIEESVGREARIERKPRHPADVDATWADIGKARKLLGWEPQVDLAEGIDRTVAWYEKNRQLGKSISLGAV